MYGIYCDTDKGDKYIPGEEQVFVALLKINMGMVLG
jgi:hypothetical protein